MADIKPQRDPLDDLSWNVLLAACQTASAVWHDNLARLRAAKADVITLRTHELELAALEQSMDAISGILGRSGDATP